ncbi:NDP-sugar epimerase, includes UDP-GlcNAc-inverting 4,6-dehydratase FlaA1 and capsular polysaccharide biosynthesis protein EpsC [Succiniclasticum ruminis]|uniref:NDP-sugar epimerase, includes UDP-GlcNAc-inverting 4,6-dehydratase FlaA1 and capsular polysaccharide biosynthesis protein EpsC n=1 Tax=Succiniclasticum ruminis TaxID=40841 RepID=A0A1G6HM52_9FIRM|nr:nucleoside-diphosphate sugar epimerase/dehydratase [Succiniclasticum ruminis]SDB95339.1 NDP-sugar epimerase, includes UDP-GlcNAc-inverting 4,6-dehydratase FlaA1 and capsular polysaccharide biosynthesis protein EpsC [Succiniclasticum ruminis]
MRRYLLPCILLLTDIVIMFGSSWLAVLIRFAMNEPQYPYYMAAIMANLPLFIIIHLLFFYQFKLYHRAWRYAGTRELIAIALANLCGIVVSYLVINNVFQLPYFANRSMSKGIFVSCFVFDVLFIGASRMFVRWAATNSEKKEVRKGKTLRVLIVGAGDAGNIILRDIRQRDHRKVVGFVDDDDTKWGQIMNGVKVYGGRQDIRSLVKSLRVDEIIIAIPSLEAVAMSDLAEICASSGVPVQILPEFFTSLDAKDIKVKDLRPLSIEDLLNRDPVRMNLKEIGSYITGKTVLVTGAGGSIGSEICRQVLRLNPSKLILLGRGENSIYEIHRELLEKAPKGVLVPYIMNITNREGMEQVYRQYHPQVVFHAAAHKHVPLMEAEPEEAVFNNVAGTLNTAELAGQYGVERFVLISTDKAVNPTSVMGATKRVTEKIGQALNKRYPNTKYMAVRFGNVLGSRGSVVPLFKKQLAKGGPLTVTHEDMKRYFMTIPEASQLVMEAGSLGSGGEVFVLDMGEPVKIMDLAKKMISLSGLVLGQDIEIKVTGLRPGEKLFEELMTAEEGTEKTSHKKIAKAILQEEDPDTLYRQIETLRSLKEENAIIGQLKTMIPTYTPNHFKAE